jgi:N-acyl-D-aspartate/D-glutamate deacylase
MHDLVLRGGLLVDGTGAPPREGDVAIDGERITAVGTDVGPGRREIDARGMIVAPGWVDIHTHYDGQATWDPYLTPSSWHGVTTVVMGNCGVGFAPARPDRHQWLISLMEGVEDIPGTALAEGITWGWQTFPEYLDALERMPRVLDIGTQVPHGAVRAYVMGERGAKNEPATAEDVAAMAEIVRDGVAAGALGFSSSRTLLHRAIDGECVPGTFAAEDELLGIGRVLGELGRGVLEVASDLRPEDPELQWMETLSRETGRPVTFACLQNDFDSGQWKRLLDASDAIAERGGWLAPQIAARPTSMLMGLQSSVHPFVLHQGYHAVAHLPLAERVARLRDPGVRAAILAEQVQVPHPLLAYITQSFHKLFPLGDPPDYEPAPERSVAAIAAREGRTPQAVAYELLLENEGRGFLYFPFLNYSDGDFAAIHEMLAHPRAVVGLADGGAHCGVICDASVPTYLLTHWVRDRTRGPRVAIETIVARQTRETARLYGMEDRGVLAPGMLADVNVIDMERLAIEVPEMIFDLPAAGRRLVQRARGYRATVKRGVVTYENGTATGELPGKLVRGPQPAPSA